MKKRIGKINVYNFLFYLAYFLYLISTFATRVVFVTPYVGKIRLISIIIFMFVCFIQSKKYPKKQLLLVFFIVLLCFVNYFISDESSLLILFLIIFSSKNLNIKKFIKKDICFKIVITISIILLYSLRLTKYYNFYQDDILRYSLGFSHPNALGAIIAAIVIEYFYLKGKKINGIDIIIVLGSCLFIYHFAHSRTSIFLILIMVMFKILYKYMKKILNNKFIKKIVCNSWIIFSVISLFFAYLYSIKSDVGIFLDELFTTRLKCIVQFFNIYPVNLFGHHLHLVGTELASITGESAAILDNAFARFLLEYGLVLYVLFSYLMKKLLNCAYENKNIILVFVLTLFTIKGVSEHSIYILSSNVFLIYLKCLFFKDNMVGEKEKYE